MKEEVNKKEAQLNPPKDTLYLVNFEGVKRFKSIRRAIRKGLVSPLGIIYPKRPFNNRKNRPLEDKKRRIYDQIKKSNVQVGV